MAIWQFLENGNPLRDGSGNLVANWDDGTGLNPGEANFSNAEALVKAQFATYPNADGASVVGYAKANVLNRADGTHSYGG